MAKLKITLTLTDEEAEALKDALVVGVANTYSPSLQARRREVSIYYQQRLDAALFTRTRARRREDSRQLSTNYIREIGRASLAAADAGTELSDDDRAAIRARFYATPEQRASNDQAFASLAEEAARLLGAKDDDTKV